MLPLENLYDNISSVYHHWAVCRAAAPTMCSVSGWAIASEPRLRYQPIETVAGRNPSGPMLVEDGGIREFLMPQDQQGLGFRTAQLKRHQRLRQIREPRPPSARYRPAAAAV